jgi:mycofactocin precursor
MSADNAVLEEDDTAVPGDTAVLDELLVEEVSIDGLCGVY